MNSTSRQIQGTVTAIALSTTPMFEIDLSTLVTGDVAGIELFCVANQITSAVRPSILYVRKTELINTSSVAFTENNAFTASYNYNNTVDITLSYAYDQATSKLTIEITSNLIADEDYTYDFWIVVDYV